MRGTKLVVVLVAVLLAACGAEDASDDGTTAETDTAGPTEDTAEPTDDATETTDDATASSPTDGDPTAADDGEPTATDEDMADAALVATAESDLGTILVDGEGRTLYVFDNDEGGESACYDGCAQTWPPLVGAVEAGDGVDAALLGTVERDDGDAQVTYDGHPLYYYAADPAPGDVNGQGVGGIWWVLGPDGQKITDTAAAPLGY